MMVKFLFDFGALVELEELGRNLVSMGCNGSNILHGHQTSDITF
jgi:hypothetical protein